MPERQHPTGELLYTDGFHLRWMKPRAALREKCGADAKNLAARRWTKGWPIGLRADGASGRNVIDHYVDQAIVTDEISGLAERIPTAGHGIA